MLTLLIQKAQAGLGTIQPAPSRFAGGDVNANIQRLISVFLGTATVIGGLIFMVMLIIGGIRWLMSAGDKAALEAARNQIVNAAIGLGLIVGAVAITFVVQTALGINILNFRLPQVGQR
jgi:cytochrome bd-type quinol oxidase subunit 2